MPNGSPLPTMDALRFTSQRKLINDLERFEVDNRQIPQLMDSAAAQSPTHLTELSTAFLRRPKLALKGWEAARIVVSKASDSADQDFRRSALKSFLQLKGEVALIQCISELPRPRAHLLLRDYFAVGGDMQSVARWFQITGGHLDGLAGGMAGGEHDQAQLAWNFMKVGRLVSSAFKNVAKSAKTVVDALFDAGKSIAEVIASAASGLVGAVADTLRGLIEGGASLTDLVSDAVGLGVNTAKKVIKALQTLGHTTVDVIDAALSLLPVPANFRKAVRALLEVGTRVVDIIVNVADRTLDAARTALDALLAEGVRMATVVSTICRHVAKELRAGFFRGLIALGRSALVIMQEAARSGAAIALAACSVLLEIWGGHRALTADERRDARKIFGWSIDLNRVRIVNDGTIPTDVAHWINNNRPFTAMYVISFPRDVDVENSRSTLIHELTHVWQAATAGPIYMVEALHSQFFGRGYEVTDKDLEDANGDLTKLEREQQAVVVERYWRGRYNDEFSDWHKYAALARQVHGASPRRMMRDLPVSVARLEAARGALGDASLR